MKTLNQAETTLIEQLFKLKQEKLLHLMSKYLKSKYKEVCTTKEYVYAVGDIPIAVVAHLDTVFTHQPDDIFYDRKKNVMLSPDGLGADDRAGVYAIIQLLKKGLRPTVIFTTDEESGALGASQLVKDHPTAFTDLKYIIQLDRRGSNDCVFYDCNNAQFEDYVEGFGFVTAYGSFSDISVICPAWEIAGVNLSIGYVNEHTYGELLYVGSMLATIEKVANMLQDVDNIDKFIYIPSPYAYKFRSLHPIDDDDDWYAWDPSYGVDKETWAEWHRASTEGATVEKCNLCGEYDYDYNIHEVQISRNDYLNVCPDCIARNRIINWCPKCGSAFFANNLEDNESLCHKCRCEEDTNGAN